MSQVKESKVEDILMIVTKDSDDSFDSLFAFIAKYDDKDDEEVSLIDIKQNLNNYFLEKA